MNFTREPIIETVITPREGCKLVVRSSKGANLEDYFVDAVEVVSFGHSFFYRSLERPKSFLVPVSDYEILELKETRMVLKSATSERSIKIGGGREAPPRPREQEPHREPQREEIAASSGDRPVDQKSPMDRNKRDRRRRGRRGRDRDRDESSPQPREEVAPTESLEGDFAPEPRQEGVQPPMQEEQRPPSFISKLFPPPPTLIKDTLSRYKQDAPPAEELFPPAAEEPVAFEEESIFEHPTMPDVSSTEELQDDEE